MKRPLLENDRMNPFYADAARNGLDPRVVVLKVCQGFMKNYSYLVVDHAGRQAVIVDPAWQLQAIEKALADSRARLGGVLLTHSHPDHVDLAEPLAEKYDCPIWMSKVEIADSAFSARRLVGFDPIPWEVGELLIEPMLTPGHTLGSTCYRIGENLFTGDVLFAEGCGICHGVEAAHAMFFSLETLKSRLRPETRIFPGHSYGTPPGQTLSQVMKDNVYLQFSTRESFAAFRLRSGQDPAKMFSFR